MLHEFIASHRDEIIARCVARAPIAAARPTAPAANRGVPLFLNELVQALRPGAVSNSRIAEGAVGHGHNLLLQGYTVSQVVHDYGSVCQAVTQLAVEMDAPISTEDFHALNQCLDDAIAGAVSQYGSERNRSTADAESARSTEQFGFLAHELRNHIHTALLAFEVLKSGDVGVNGTTGGVLGRSLLGLRALVEGALNDVRASRSTKAERFRVAELIEEIVPSARVEAHSRGATLLVRPVDGDAFIEGDPKVLAAVVSNLLQNAFKYTRTGTAVTLRVHATAARVLIEVEDECGGLGGGNAHELFRPFEQRHADRTGLGLGLAFGRWGAQMSNGRLYPRNLPGKGCIFILDLPRADEPSRANPSKEIS